MTLIIYSAVSKPHDVTVEIPLITPHGGGNLLSSAFSDNKIIHLKDLPFGSYNVMAMRETQTQFGEKFIMLIATDQKGALGLCYSNTYIETYLREHLTEADKEKFRDPKINYLTLFEKPLAALKITGWGRTPQKTSSFIATLPSPKIWKSTPLKICANK